MMLKQRILRSLIILCVSCMVWISVSFGVKAESALGMDKYKNVEVSPDGTGWRTISHGAEILPKGTEIVLSTESNRTPLLEGQHYYGATMAGKEVRVGYWRVHHSPGHCIHGGLFEGTSFAGWEPANGICRKYYDSGWYAYCADCGRNITNCLIYADSDTVRGISTVPGAAKYAFYCPWSNALEQGTGYEHFCDVPSWNYYKVAYLKNVPEDSIAGVAGQMPRTYHMWNNEALYEGVETSYKDTSLRKNTYTCTGYRFVGWNTEADGSGEWFSDGQEVLNLAGAERDDDFINLYAQWERVESTLTILGNGGTYQGQSEYSETKTWGETLYLWQNKVSAPEGYTVVFDTNGGSQIDSIKTTKSFAYWQPQSDFQGRLRDNIYTYDSLENGHEDFLKVVYKNDTITLPYVSKGDSSFAGWYYDTAFEELCGQPGEEVVFTKNTILYARFVDLALWSADNYEVNDGKGAVDLWWEQNDGKTKTYKAYQSTDLVNWRLLASSDTTSHMVSGNSKYTYKNGGYELEVEYAGYYTLSAAGGKGADYNAEKVGGKGGYVSATYYLEKGDKVKYYPGTQGNGTAGGVNSNGADGGTSTTVNGVGGGAASEVYLVRDGESTLLLSAGGGGGANSFYSGGNGGDENATTESCVKGASTDVGGGGGGYLGGASSLMEIVGVSSETEFSYTGGVQEFVAPYSTTYYGTSGAGGGSGYIGGVSDASMMNGVNYGNGRAVITCSELHICTMNGGANYVNTDFNCKDIELLSGVNDGDGYIICQYAFQYVEEVDKTFVYWDGGMEYVIPYTGYYQLTAYGGKGGDFESYVGGSGGVVTATYWLKEGDVVTSYSGTQGSGLNGGKNGNGADGGSSTDANASGGGAASEVFLTRNGEKTLLLSAGGGGGANSLSNGGDGGEITSVGATRVGESGNHGGGGGGYFGGIAQFVTQISPEMETEFSYTGGVQEFVAPYSTTYTLEAWGAQGGSYYTNPVTGGYSIGYLEMEKGDKIYICVGGQGTWNNGVAPGGYNGGGIGRSYGDGGDGGCSGGGCTSITTTNRGVLSNFNSYRGEVLMVAGGGGGGGGWPGYITAGGKGGGLSGENGGQNHAGDPGTRGTGGTQTGAGVGGGFGYGGSATGRRNEGGGGGGYFGGGYGTDQCGGGGGSGFVGNVKDGSTTTGVNAGNGRARISTNQLDVYSAFGGSNYINKNFGCRLAYSNNELNDKSGYVRLKSVQVGYQEDTRMDGVYAMDLAAPDKVEEIEVLLSEKGLERDTFRVSYSATNDNGTTYYHQVKSYVVDLGLEVLLSESNITENTLTSGYKGVRYYVDEKPYGTVTKGHALNSGGDIEIEVEKGETLYLHLAAVDVADNVSATTNVELKSNGMVYTNFPPVVEEFSINVASVLAQDEISPLYKNGGTTYLRADGVTEYLFSAKASILDGMEQDDYQTGSITMNMKRVADGNIGFVKAVVPYGYGENYNNSDISVDYTEEDNGLIYITGDAMRDSSGGLKVNQILAVEQGADGQIYEIYPSAEAYYEDLVVYSDNNNDLSFKASVFADGMAPLIVGMEALETMTDVNMSEQGIGFTVSASDTGSGMRTFSVKIKSLDTYYETVFTDTDGDGNIVATIPMFDENADDAGFLLGDIEVTALAYDNVGNKSEKVVSGSFISLEAELEELLEPLDGLYARGESANLDIVAGGYVDSVFVDFPESWGNDVDVTYQYDIPEMIKREDCRFSIPLAVSNGIYDITITANKGEKTVSVTKSLSVDGSVLDGLHSRLRFDN